MANKYKVIWFDACEKENVIDNISAQVVAEIVYACAISGLTAYVYGEGKVIFTT